MRSQRGARTRDECGAVRHGEQRQLVGISAGLAGNLAPSRAARELPRPAAAPFFRLCVSVEESMFRNEYSTDVTTFSPEGRVHQIEFAIAAVKGGSVCVALRSRRVRCCGGRDAQIF